MLVESPTYFAPPEKEDQATLRHQLETLRSDPMVDQLLDSFPDPTLILNSRRQIVRGNEQSQRVLGLSREEMLGLRLGEALQCPRAHDRPAGCGTTQGCRYCGAVRAIMNCQSARVADVQVCRVESRASGEPVSLDLRVSAAPICCRGEEFTVCALHDITDQMRRQLLERVFFHDLLNSAGSLKAMVDLSDQLHGQDAKATWDTIRGLSAQIVEEIQSQRDLLAAETGDLATTILDVNVSELLNRLCTAYRHHSLGADKKIVLALSEDSPVIWTDEVLLGRALGNLLKNALEATEPGQTVTVSCEHGRQTVFSIHNPSVMPEAVQLQMFQRSFTTKSGLGRGIGSYSVRLLTERYLNGKVWFASREPEGTTFSISLPSPSPDVLSQAFVYQGSVTNR